MPVIRRSGSEVNSLVRQSLKVTLRDPIGLYIQDIALEAFSGPNGEDCSDCWNIVRGRPGLILRAEFRVPAGLGFALDEVQVEGEALQGGAQIAEHISMVLYGKAHNFGSALPQPLPCGWHCCTLQENPRILRTIEANLTCQSLNSANQNWTESFPQAVDLTERLRVGLAAAAELSSLPIAPDFGMHRN